MSDDPVIGGFELGTPPWPTLDPFLFCVHHDDQYPEGNEHMGPHASLEGRNIGMDFAGIDGWRMYHGDVIPGFPQHPHRGFETVTLARNGFIDHSDSLGATARFGHGDAQWMTAGKGIVHSEMFPLVKRDQPNPTELFQLWLNLPRENKMVDPHFAMLWSEQIPRVEHVDDQGRRSEVVVVAGEYQGHRAPPPPPNSWAARAESDVAIWTIKLDPGASVTLPAGQPGTHRVLYYFRGEQLRVGPHDVEGDLGLQMRPEIPVTLVNGSGTSELLMLQGRPIGEPVVQHGPFVMNSQGEIRQAIMDYQRTRFGGWPWKTHGPVHDRESGRFAIHADGHREDAGPA